MFTVKNMVRVNLPDSECFLKIKETLTRIGVASKKDQTLYQSCHILHKKGEYFICHFKELFALDGKPTNIAPNDIERRNTIINLLEQWGLITIPDKSAITSLAPMNQIKIIPHKEKSDWTLVSKYTVGKVRTTNEVKSP